MKIKGLAERGVQICEDANNVFEISTRSVRVERGDLELYYPDDFEPEPVIECFAQVSLAATRNG